MSGFISSRPRVDLYPQLPSRALDIGCINEPMGTHSSRTLMLTELRSLMDACDRDASIEGYRRAVVDENVVLKSTLSTRAKTFRHLRELYALSGEIPLF